jgi:diacylglycerol kinase (ATP)
VSICLIFNPAARGEKAKKFQRGIEAFQGKFALKPTHCAGAARHLAAEAVREGYTTIVAAGGDGTLNEVLNGIGDADGFGRVRLGVLPLGTINVFARELRMPAKLDQVWPLMESATEIKLDVGCAEFRGNSGVEKRLFLQLAGAGLDARAVELVSWELKKKIGPGAYLVAGFKALGATQPKITLRSEKGEEARGELVLIGNGRLYGGDFPLFHKSDLQDGVLDAVLFEEVNWKKLPSLGWDFLLGRLFKEGRTRYLQGSTLNLCSDSRAAVQLDGEYVGELPCTFSVLPKVLRVVAPRSGGLRAGSERENDSPP